MSAGLSLVTSTIGFLQMQPGIVTAFLMATAVFVVLFNLRADLAHGRLVRESALREHRAASSVPAPLARLATSPAASERRIVLGSGA